jgi:hypothetical protein
MTLTFPFSFLYYLSHILLKYFLKINIDNFLLFLLQTKCENINIDFVFYKVELLDKMTY